MAIYRGSESTGTATQVFNIDGDKGDITVTNGGDTWTIDAGVVTTTKLGGDITPQGKALLDDATAAQQRTTLGLGSAAVTEASAYLASTSIGNTVQAYDSNLTSFVNTFTLPVVDGANNTVLSTDGFGNITFRAIAGAGTVTSVDMTVPIGLSVTGNPITTGGTLAVTYSAGYAIPTTSKQTQWDTAYSWGDHASVGYLTSAAINTTVQGYSANLAEYSAVNPTAAGLALLDDVDASAQRDTLGLGTIATQPANNVAITGGSVTGITDLAILDGGTGASTGAQAKINLEVISSATGSEIIPAGTTAQRDVTPSTGYFRFNTSTTKFEGYNGTAWGSVGGGATGSSGDEVFVENSKIVTASYTLSTGKNAMSTGPITVNSGATVTVPTGARWVIL